jgi:hypothetical protein
VRGNFHCQAGLADAAEPDQRHQAARWIIQQRADFFDFWYSTKKRG